MLESLAHDLGLDKIGRAALAPRGPGSTGAPFDFICLGGVNPPGIKVLVSRGTKTLGIGKSGQTAQPS